MALTRLAISSGRGALVARKGRTIAALASALSGRRPPATSVAAALSWCPSVPQSYRRYPCTPPSSQRRRRPRSLETAVTRLKLLGSVGLLLIRQVGRVPGLAVLQTTHLLEQPPWRNLKRRRRRPIGRPAISQRVDGPIAIAELHDTRVETAKPDIRAGVRAVRPQRPT